MTRFRMPRRPLALGAALAVLGGFTAVSLAAPSQAAGTPLPTAVFTKTSDWGSGFEASYTITNNMTVLGGVSVWIPG